MAARASGFRPSNATSRGAYTTGKDTIKERVYDLRDSTPSTATQNQGHPRKSWHKYGEILFRTFGLQFFNNFTPWRQDVEFPKTAIEKNRWMVLIRCLIHIPPLAGCVTLLALMFTTIVVEQNSAFSILQFAAKLLEILMQASIAAILLSHVRYEITQNGCIPFGSLFAPSQISSIGYIWSAEMFGTFKSTGMGWVRKSALILHTVFAIVLAAVVGPSSAILMLPHPIQPLFGQCTVTLPTTLDILHPSRLSLNSPGKADFAAVSRLYGNINSQDQHVSVKDTAQASLGTSMFDRVSSRMLNKLADTTSAPLQLTADAMSACKSASWNKFENSMSLESRQPFVWPLNGCTATPITHMDPSSQLIIPQDFGWPRLDGTDAKLNMTLGEFNNSYKETNSSHILWAAPPKEYAFASSIIAVVAPDLKHVGTGVPWYWTCPAAASWVPATVNTSELGQVQTYPTIEAERSMDAVPEAATVISIDPAWAYNATANASPRNQTIGAPTLGDLLDLSYILANDDGKPWNGTYNWSVPYMDRLIISGIISTAISSILTVNAINVTYVNTTYKRTDSTIPQGIWWPNITSFPQTTAYNESTFPSGTISAEEALLLADQDPSRSFVIDVFGKSLIGYAFESIPSKIATVVICVYCFYVLMSIIVSIIVGISSNSWDSVSEITALALNSTPPSHLGPISAGLNTLRVFQEPVGIFTSEKDNLELVFRQGNGGLDEYMVMERNREY